MKVLYNLVLLVLISFTGLIAQSEHDGNYSNGHLDFGKMLSEDITIDPFPFSIDDEITITIKTKNDCSDLSSEKMYMHSGMGPESNAWTYVVGNWGEDDGFGLMTNNNNGTQSITISPKSYYSIPSSAEGDVSKMGMVFRNHDGSKKLQYSVDGTCSGEDYFVGVGVFQINLVEPNVSDGGVIVLKSGETLNIKATSTENADFSIKESGNIIATESDKVEIVYTKTVSETQEYTIEANNGSETKSISFTVFIESTPVVEDLPSGMKDGINYYEDDDTKVTLVLHAPNKAFAYVKGDFSDWKISSEYSMKVTKSDLSDSDIRYWVTINGLESGKEYAFQYVVDGEKILADPYTEKVLDPWNDQHIPAEIYPNLKPYPVGKTEGIVSVLQTGQEEYNWKNNDFVKPKKENLIIYELLVRDFVYKHSYQSLIDTLNYLERMNINAIELMPINEFEGNESWGYNPSFMFAPDKYYGTKDKLKEFIDEAHGRGIAVIIDIVMNHSFGQSPFVQLYDWHNGDGQIIMDEDSPWFNVESPNGSYHWGADFNHESKYTKDLLDNVNKFWIQEYKVDGFRFDFTKGFTNTKGDGWAKDNSRITILKRMYDEIVAVNPDAYVILEHLADNSEEKILAEHGMMLWGNMTHNYGEASMGFNEGNKSDLSYASHVRRGWSKAHLISYSSSHDEERIAFKNSQWGNSDGSYNIKDKSTSMERMQLQALFLWTIPGPKMLWQFDEVGYDIGIDDPCRVCNKPIKWGYIEDSDRIRVYNLHKAIMKLKKTEAAFSTENFILDVDNGAKKSIVLEHSDMNVVLVGNFDVKSQTVSVTFPSTGTYYEYFTGARYDISSTDQSVPLTAGAYKLYTTKNLDTPNLDESISLSIDEISFDKNESINNLSIYPVPIRGNATIKYSISEKSPVNIDVFNLQGQVVESYRFDNQAKGTHTVNWQVDNSNNTGVYFIRISTALESFTRKITIE
ncbi:MAG: T9SS type A sorting domain-containing protein [Flavobacteriales bacterium]|nr:T9SS type A sorting domain-containing protein [Flavobacteriales bacterium]